jgi:hypothetical protein
VIRTRSKHGSWAPSTGFRSEIPGLRTHIGTDPPLYKILHHDGGDPRTTWGRVYVTSDEFVECFICDQTGAYIGWGGGQRQAISIPANSITSMERRRARDRGWR